MKIAHITSAHPRTDTRIFVKECQSLARAGFDVLLLVADGKGDELVNGVKFLDVGKPSGRLDRIFRITKRLFDEAMRLDCDCYHLHDPELLPLGLKLKRLGKVVVFDAHEDLPEQIKGKPYLAKPVRQVLSWLAKRYETWALSRLDGVVAATPFIKNKFLKVNSNTIDINNFPILEEFACASGQWGLSRNSVVYVGGLSKARGIREIICALNYAGSELKLKLAGNFTEKEFERECRQMSAWEKVDYLGFLDRSGVSETLGHSFAGLVTLHPLINYLDALPVKMFEYMAAGLPVIASNFPLWASIINEAECGICVDPMDPKEIAEAILYLEKNPDVAERMGRKGLKAVQDKFNWKIEEAKLIEFYRCM